MDPDLEHLVTRAAGPPAATPDLQALAARAAKRRRTRRVVAATAVAAALALVFPAWQALRPPPEVLVVDQPGVELTPALVAFDPVADVTGQTPRLSTGAATRQPRLLPAGTHRCVGPQPVESTVRTAYCGPHGPVELRTGDHASLDETGQPVRIGSRTGWLDRLDDGRWQLTLSDRDSMDDRHYRITAPSDWNAASVVGVLRSVPAVAAATD